MDASGVVVIGETPSLGEALVDLLRSDAIPVHYITAEPQRTREHLPRSVRVMIVASNSPFSPAARGWLAGEYSPRELVVVGSRDPALASARQIHRVPLPLDPERFLGLVRKLLAGEGTDPT